MIIRVIVGSNNFIRVYNFVQQIKLFWFKEKVFKRNVIYKNTLFI